MVWYRWRRSRHDVLGVIINGDGVEEGCSWMDGKRDGERERLSTVAVSRV